MENLLVRPTEVTDRRNSKTRTMPSSVAKGKTHETMSRKVLEARGTREKFKAYQLLLDHLDGVLSRSLL